MEVPVDWAKPDGPTMKIAVARQKATDPKKRIGVLLSNPGGPGPQAWTRPTGRHPVEG